ncbi:MAG: hypothetical protein AB1724_12180 [Thermodesulfobacteriota bacterium]
MLEPVLFPFTCLDEKTAGMLLACFDRIRVYLPTDSAAGDMDPDVLKTGLVTAVNPLADSGLQADRIFQEYRQWRQANRGTDISFFKMSGSTIPFFDESTISFLKQDIVHASSRTEKEPDLLLAARVFLRMTGNYDRAQADIAEDLLLQSEKELTMLAALHGDDDDDDQEDLTVPAAQSLTADTGELMTRERLTAWSMLTSENDALPSLFVTPSRAVFAAVMDHFESHTATWENIPAPGDLPHRDDPVLSLWRQDLSAFFNGLLKGDAGAPPPCPLKKPGAFLTVIRLAEISPRDFLKKLQTPSPERLKHQEKQSVESTIVAAVFPA